MARDQNTRPKRWARAVAELSEAQGEISSAVDRFNTALNDVRDLQQEYSDWNDNLPESLQSSPVGEKLQAIVDLDLEDIELDGIDDKVSEIESAELPLGFGKD